jgi:tetratricopeptide (TPR) repeat protein
VTTDDRVPHEIGEFLRESVIDADPRLPEDDALRALIQGILFENSGDNAAATAAFQRAIDSHDREAAPLAAFKLALLLEDDGDVADATTAYQWAIDSRHAEHVP